VRAAKRSASGERRKSLGERCRKQGVRLGKQQQARRAPRHRIALLGSLAHTELARPRARRLAALARHGRARELGANLLFVLPHRREGARSATAFYVALALLTASPLLHRALLQATHPLVAALEKRIVDVVNVAHKALLAIDDAAPSEQPVSFVAAEPLQVVRYSVSQGERANLRVCVMLCDVAFIPDAASFVALRLQDTARTSTTDLAVRRGKVRSAAPVWVLPFAGTSQSSDVMSARVSCASHIHGVPVRRGGGRLHVLPARAPQHRLWVGR
jgi:hypothetical protein